MAQQLMTVATLTEDWGLIPSSYMAAHDCL